MLSTWPRTVMVCARRQLGPELGGDPLDRGGDAAEVAVLHVGVDVEDRLHVRVADDGRELPALERRQVAEQLGRAGVAAVTDVFISVLTESTRLCGVCTATR